MNERRSGVGGGHGSQYSYAWVRTTALLWGGEMIYPVTGYSFLWVFPFVDIHDCNAVKETMTYPDIVLHCFPRCGSGSGWSL